MSSQNFSISHCINSIHTNWKNILLKYIDPYETEIDSKINEDMNSIDVYPPPELIFNAFNKFNTTELKVVLIGQDPYINPGEAMGLSFSVPEECKTPPSLRNIFKELEWEYGKDIKTSKDFTKWAEQGVLLLNAALTVRRGESASHMKLWRNYTNDIIRYLSSNYTNTVYILWGDFARKYNKLLNKENNLILEWSHPSPLCRKPFVGNNHFKLCNEYLKRNNKATIKWV